MRLCGRLLLCYLVVCVVQVARLVEAPTEQILRVDLSNKRILQDLWLHDVLRPLEVQDESLVRALLGQETLERVIRQVSP